MHIYQISGNGTWYLFLGQSGAVEVQPEQKNQFAKVLQNANESENRSYQERGIFKSQNQKVKRKSITRGWGWYPSLPWGILTTHSLAQASRSWEGQWKGILCHKTYLDPCRRMQCTSRSLLIKCFWMVKTTRQGTAHGACFVRNYGLFISTSN